MKLLKFTLLVFAMIVLAAGSAFASYSYDITVNTSALNGQTGYLYFDYASMSNQASTATVTNFATDSALGGQDFNVVSGSAVTGTLPGTLSFVNTFLTNDYQHAVTTFGNSISFLVSFSGPATSGTSGSANSTFSMGLFSDNGGLNPFFSSNVGANNELFDITLNDGGNTSFQNFGAASPATGTAAPIPPTALLFAAGLFGLVGLRKMANN